MNRKPFRYIKPVLPPPEDWIPYLQESYAECYFANFGPTVRAFEQRLTEKYARHRSVVTAPSATAGLVCALQTLNARGKVLVPAYTFPATVHAIIMSGCEPVFCDIAEDSWELDSQAVASALDRHDIKVILHVRAYGFNHDLSWLEAMAHSHNIPLIIDSASALGSEESLNGHIGQQGTLEVFSFHATKVFAIGEGAAIFMERNLEESFRATSNFGLRYPDVISPGLNSKMSDVQAAVGLAMMEIIDSHVARRKELAACYYERLHNLTGIAKCFPHTLAPWQTYPIRLNEALSAESVLYRAAETSLELRRGYFRPLHQTSQFAHCADLPLPETDRIASHVICLPVYSDMSDAVQDEIIDIFLRAIKD